ncbi:hypothetical protein KJ855_03095 [Patescibacteria group bacterium]|nr:hypothetical protein [Patescibacteria group bacterium]
MRRLLIVFLCLLMVSGLPVVKAVQEENNETMEEFPDESVLGDDLEEDVVVEDERVGEEEGVGVDDEEIGGGGEGEDVVEEARGLDEGVIVDETEEGEEITVNGDGVIEIVNEDGEVVVISEEEVEVIGDVDVDIDEVNIGPGGVEIIRESTSERGGSNYLLKKITNKEIIVADGEEYITIKVGKEGLSTTDSDKKIVVEYADSGIDETKIKIGDKTGIIYIKTDKGSVELKVLPHEVVKDALKGKKTEVNKIKFKWRDDGKVLYYVVEVVKSEKALGLFPVKITEFRYYDVTDGKLVKTEKSWWQKFVDLISF